MHLELRTSFVISKFCSFFTDGASLMSMMALQMTTVVF
uniref:Uncharacterized protein n=1 Tax=Rhizophora mucronata TaxID=61149 RepID=A0A2P2KY34_RHIMU